MSDRYVEGGKGIIAMCRVGVLRKLGMEIMILMIAARPIFTK